MTVLKMWKMAKVGHICSADVIVSTLCVPCVRNVP